ncbi:MAG: 16S rRNA (guanine(966)-N(2))-methyltransferase RsmD [Firmicutes bacterium]|nr:16S rRNA (guanine(966)-N(2))-methyltransferase RsmD [Bacillota bacterium]
MRVIGGIYGGRRLRTLRGLALRPTSDRLRETLFDILGATVAGSVFVDLYAGSGAVGIEALSRGARQVVFIEKHRPAVAVIQGNLQRLGFAASTQWTTNEPTARALLLATDVPRGLARLAERGFRADFVFADPPYADAQAYTQVLESLDRSSLLNTAAHVILEHSRRQPLPERTRRLTRVREVRQGDTVLSFYRVVST